MTAGELDYGTVFWFRGLPDDTELAANDTMIASNNSADLNYFRMSCILWVIFIIMMPVLFANLLVSSASYYQYCTTRLMIYTDWSCCWWYTESRGKGYSNIPKSAGKVYMTETIYLSI